MASSRRSRQGGILLAMILGAAGCSNSEYMNHWDTSSARTGNASQANTAIQVNQAWPPAAYRTTVGSGG